jgi:formylglycine-generating enzyme required for sulfatase activity
MMRKKFCFCRALSFLAIFSSVFFFLSCNQRPGKPEVISNDAGEQLEPRHPSAKQNLIPLPPLGDAFTVTSSGTEMLFVSPGVFTMGSPTDELGREPIETQHGVTLTQGFWLGKYEITNLEWEKVMNPVESTKEDDEEEKEEVNGDKKPPPDPYADVVRPRFPKVNVNWIDAMNFCEKLIAAEKKIGTLPESFVYNLPTEAQWEYACRAGTVTAVSFGEVLGAGDAAIDPQRPYGAVAKARIPKRIHEVGEYKPNSWGFHDMHGHAAEWCRDFFFARYPAGTIIDPLHEDNTGLKVKRGGSFFLDGASARSAKRGSDSPNRRSDELGFRIALVRKQ